MKKLNISLIFFLSFATCFGQLKIPAGYHTFTITNCGKESRIVKPLASLRTIRYLVAGSAELKKMKILNFSNPYNVDSNYILTNVAKLKATLPNNFFWSLSGYEYLNQPNENSIWFTYIFAEITNSGRVKIFSAYKMTFEGNDPGAESFRADPKVTNIQFILDKKQLIELEKKLKVLSGGIIH